MTKINANQREIEDSVREFVREIQNGDVALFYFSGHGVQVHGDNYLIPVGVSIASEADVRYKTVPAGYILAEMDESRNRTNIFILDACRNNPFKSFRSLSKGLTMMDAPVGTFIAYATAPGSVAADGTGRNSPYAEHLMQAMKLKGMKIEEVFKQVLRDVRKDTGGKQVPWTASSLQDDFWFNPSAKAGVQEASLPSSTSPEVTSVLSTKYREKAERLVTLLVTRGEAASREELNRMYKDPKAVKWFREAGEQGDPVAQLMLGRMFALGLEVPKDYDEAVKWYRKAAEQGNTMGQSNLGWMSANGFGVAKDYSEAVKWYRKSADQGNAWGQNNLGWMYAQGKGIAKDYEEAVKWYKKSADQGNSLAQGNLGFMYKNGYGVAKDRTEAIKWYRKAADQGNKSAKKELQKLGNRGLSLGYREKAERAGTLVAANGRAEEELMMYKDPEMVKWFRRAGQLGDAVAQVCLGRMFELGLGVPRDYHEAVQWFKKAAYQGNSRAQNNMGLMCRSGTGVPKDYHEAVRWFKKAAEQGQASAQVNLGWMYQNGYGVHKDRTEAIKWYKKAAHQGNEDAEKFLRKMGVAVK